MRVGVPEIRCVVLVGSLLVGLVDSTGYAQRTAGLVPATVRDSSAKRATLYHSAPPKSVFGENSMLPRGPLQPSSNLAPERRAGQSASPPQVMRSRVQQASAVAPNIEANAVGSAVRRSSFDLAPTFHNVPNLGDCGCDSCDGGGCDGCCEDKKMGCGIYGFFDCLAGGIEHVLGLDGRCPSGGCDDLGCDGLACGGVSLHPMPTQMHSAAPLYPAPTHSAPLPPAAVPTIQDLPAAEPTAPKVKALPVPEMRNVPNRLPAPIVPDQLVDPFEDDQTFIPGRNPKIKPSAYYAP